MSGMDAGRIASAGRLAGIAQVRAVRQRIAERAAAERPEWSAATVWRRMGLEARMVLVSLCVPGEGDPTREATRTWESFTHDQRAAMGACARQLRRDLAGADFLRV